MFGGGSCAGALGVGALQAVGSPWRAGEPLGAVQALRKSP